MSKPMIAVAGTLIVILVAAGCALTTSGDTESGRVTAKQLAGMLDRSDVTVVDVRAAGDWNKSESKIKGAVREDLSAITSWMDTYPKGKTLVFYCA